MCFALYEIGCLLATLYLLYIIGSLTVAQVDLKLAALVLPQPPFMLGLQDEQPLWAFFSPSVFMCKYFVCVCGGGGFRNWHLPYFEAGFLTVWDLTASEFQYLLIPASLFLGYRPTASGCGFIFFFFNKTRVLGIKLRSSCLKDILKIVRYGLAHSPSPLFLSEGL